MKIYYAANGDREGVQRHENFVGLLNSYPIEVMDGEGDVAEADGLVAEITGKEIDPNITDLVLKAHELGKKVLLLANRSESRGIPEQLVGISKIRPDTGVRYSGSEIKSSTSMGTDIGESAIKVFLAAHFGLYQEGTEDTLNLSEAQHLKVPKQ